jgi:hypothetical protein
MANEADLKRMLRSLLLRKVNLARPALVDLAEALKNVRGALLD